jgi:hypothetical protein
VCRSACHSAAELTRPPQTFFDIHDDYFQIGKLSLPKVDTSKPPPPPCASPVGAVPA